jgi:hypothetical protein
VPGEGLVKLEEGTVSGVRVREKYGVRKVLGQPIGVRDGNHFVVDAIHYERGLMDALEIAEAGSRRLLPLPERRHLCGDDVPSGSGVEILGSLCKPLDKRSTGRLARRSRREENLLVKCWRHTNGRPGPLPRRRYAYVWFPLGETASAPSCCWRSL